MKNPYKVLGISENATSEEVKQAYRELAKKYHPDNYADSPLADVAEEKMKEINEAYDAINSGEWKQSQQNYDTDQSYAYTNSYSDSYQTHRSSPIYLSVRQAIERNRCDEANSILDQIPYQQRGGEWNFLKGEICSRRGWFEKAAEYYTTAYNLEPNNPEYRRAYADLSGARSGGYRTTFGRSSQRSDSDGGFCTMCQGLLCADCCCECMGGDLIPCC